LKSVSLAIALFVGVGGGLAFVAVAGALQEYQRHVDTFAEWQAKCLHEGRDPVMNYRTGKRVCLPR